MPGSPELGKWTKCGPALDRVILGSLFSLVFGHAFYAAFKEKALPLVATAINLGEAFAHDVEFNVLHGKKITVSIDLLKSREQVCQLLVVLLCLEPLRILTRVFMRLTTPSGSDVKVDNNSVPAVCHFVSDMFTVRIDDAVCQFILHTGIKKQVGYVIRLSRSHPA